MGLFGTNWAKKWANTDAALLKQGIREYVEASKVDLRNAGLQRCIDIIEKDIDDLVNVIYMKVTQTYMNRPNNKKVDPFLMIETYEKIYIKCPPYDDEGLVDQLYQEELCPRCESQKNRGNGICQGCGRSLN